jgi:hypothetical protein
MLMTVLAAAPADPGGLSVNNPLVLGPIAAFIFTIFITEVVVSGKAYRREVAENERLRALTEQVIPLAENMVKVTSEQVEVTKNVTRVLDQVTDLLRDKKA